MRGERDCPVCFASMKPWCLEVVGVKGGTQVHLWKCDPCAQDYCLTADGDEEPHLMGISVIYSDDTRK